MKKVLLPSERLFAPRRPVRTVLVVVGAAALIAVSALTANTIQVRADNTADAVRGVATPNLLSHSEIVQVADIAQDSLDAAAATDQRKADAAAALAAQQAATAAAQQPVARSSAATVRCPAGTVAGAVDGNGNESNCQTENGAGETCQAYNDQNECIGWAKP